MEYSIPKNKLRACIKLALTYHEIKDIPRLEFEDHKLDTTIESGPLVSDAAISTVTKSLVEKDL